jgi:hypothetical protein
MTVIIAIYVFILRHMKINSFATGFPGRRAERRRQRRELRLYCRILILISVLFIMGVPYCVFFLISMINGFSPAPPYADRVCFLFISIGYSVSMLLSLLYTDDVREIFIRFMGKENQNTRRGQVQCSTALAMRPIRTNVTINT